MPGGSSFTFGAPVPPATGGFSFGPAAPAPATPAPAATAGFSFGSGAPAPTTPSAAPAAPAAPFGSAPTSSAFTVGGGSASPAPFGGGSATPAAFGSANKSKYKKEDISLVTAADVEPIASALRASPAERLELIGAPVDCEETPTVSDAAAPALAEALKSCKASLRSVKLKNHRFESDAAMSTVLGALCGCTVLEELDLTNSSLKEAGGRHATPSQSKAGH